MSSEERAKPLLNNLHPQWILPVLERKHHYRVCVAAKSKSQMDRLLMAETPCWNQAIMTIISTAYVVLLMLILWHDSETTVKSTVMGY